MVKHFRHFVKEKIICFLSLSSTGYGCGFGKGRKKALPRSVQEVRVAYGGPGAARNAAGRNIGAWLQDWQLATPARAEPFYPKFNIRICFIFVPNKSNI